jgi:hypothetical protein
MDKEIVLLTKSKKRGNYCIAGVDRKTGEWIRIISEDASIQHAVSPVHTKYEDGCISEVMDIVRIRCKGPNPEFHQPENFVMDRTVPWKKKGTVSVRQLLQIHNVETKPFLFYNADRCVDSDILKRLRDEELYSLILIKPEDICIHIKEWPKGKQATLSFNYSGSRYWYIRITDTDFERNFLDYPEGNYNYNVPCLFVISLGDKHTDDKHWKLIAKVLYI